MWRFTPDILMEYIGGNGSMFSVAIPMIWIGMWRTLMIRMRRHLTTPTRV